MKRILFPIAILLLAACSEDPSRNLYEGIKGSNDAKRTPNDRAISPSPSYDDYKKEREQK
jgi:hypothetical protein